MCENVNSIVLLACSDFRMTSREYVPKNTHPKSSLDSKDNHYYWYLIIFTVKEFHMFLLLSE